MKMGDIDVADIQAYMKCLSSFQPGQSVDITVLRDGKEITKRVTF
jgi:S1-C subfamily serine protease